MYKLVNLVLVPSLILVILCLTSACEYYTTYTSDVSSSITNVSCLCKYELVLNNVSLYTNPLNEPYYFTYYCSHYTLHYTVKTIKPYNISFNPLECDKK
jgi:hypothetical protein